jgi:hypothetical protein
LILYTTNIICSLCCHNNSLLLLLSHTLSPPSFHFVSLITILCHPQESMVYCLTPMFLLDHHIYVKDALFLLIIIALHLSCYPSFVLYVTSVHFLTEVVCFNTYMIAHTVIWLQHEKSGRHKKKKMALTTHCQHECTHGFTPMMKDCPYRPVFHSSRQFAMTNVDERQQVVHS